MNNGKKEFPKNGLEEDANSKWGRKYLCYINNISGIKKYVKKTMNKRFRKQAKLDIKNQQEEDLMTADELYIEDILNKFK